MLLRPRPGDGQLQSTSISWHELGLETAAQPAVAPELISSNDEVVMLSSGKPLTRLVDDIYEAAFMPELWSGVLDRSAKAIDAEGALLFSANGTQSQSIVSDGIRELVKTFNETGWSARNVRATRLLSDYRNGFVTDSDLFSPEEIDTQPMYAEFLRPNGYGWGAATSVQLPSGENFVISYEKKHMAGPVDGNAVALLDTLRPHFFRAALLSSRLSFERASGALNALEMIGLPSALIARDAKILAANRPFEHYSPAFRIGSNDRLSW